MQKDTINKLDRREVVARLLGNREAQYKDGLIVITGLGSPTYDVHAAGDQDANFYLWGAMGSAALTGLGLALARPEQKILVITGDGEQLMGLGGLATIGVQNPDNLSIVVLDNGHYGETGMQPSHTSQGVDLVGIAASCGIARCLQITEMQQVSALAENLFAANGTSLINIAVGTHHHPRSIPALDGVYLKNRIRQRLGLAIL